MTRYIATPPYSVYVRCPNGSKRPLPLRKDLCFHSKEFCWGYGGSGPAQLALAMLVHSLRDVKKARGLYQQFKWRCVARLPQDAPWELSRDEILGIVAQIEAES